MCESEREILSFCNTYSLALSLCMCLYQSHCYTHSLSLYSFLPHTHTHPSTLHTHTLSHTHTYTRPPFSHTHTHTLPLRHSHTHPSILHQASGLSRWLTDIVLEKGPDNFTSLTVSASVCSCILTNFISNTAAANIIIPSLACVGTYVTITITENSCIH